MSTEVVMPQMGESLSEGTITKWLKKPGDDVERDEPLFEITTDKVDTEVPAPSSGSVERILVGEGETVSVGTVVALIRESERDGAGPPPAGAKSPAPSSPSPPSTGANRGGGGGHFRDAHETQLFRRKPVSPKSQSAPRPSGRARLSPAVLALAAEHELSPEELRSIPGSGRGGRVTRKDVERYLETRAGSGLAPASRAVTAPAGEPPSRFLYQPEPEDELVPMSAARREIADHLLWSQRSSAQVTSFTECDMHRIVRFANEAGAAFRTREGAPLSVLPFVADAVVKALREFPIFNASVVGERIAMRKHVHLAVAGSIEEGLVVPVVKRADEMSFLGLARAIHALTERARREGLAADEVRGASFTIASPGTFGGMMGTPIIPQPQVATLGLGSVQKKPVVVDDAIAIRPIMALALSFDHRIIDGATAFQFLETIRGLLESYDRPDI